MSASNESALSFDVIDDKWLDVLNLNGITASVTLRELLCNAHQISRLSEPSPLTEVALLRFLIALVSDGLRATLQAEDDWDRFADQCRDGLPTHVIDAILAPLVGRSDVLDANHDAFFDGPAIRDGRRTGKIYPPKDEGSPPSDVLLSIPTGSEIGHFHRVENGGAICVRCLLKGTFAKSLFSTGGGGGYSSGAAGAKPAFVVLVAGTLLDTLLLNVVIADSDDLPAWRKRFHRSIGRLPKTIERMSWRARLYAPRFSSQCTRSCSGCGRIDLPTFSALDRADGFKATSWADGFIASRLLGKKSDDDDVDTDVDDQTCDPHLIEQSEATSRSVLSKDPTSGLIARVDQINESLARERSPYQPQLTPFRRVALWASESASLRLVLFASLGDPKKMNIEEVRHAELRIKLENLEHQSIRFSSVSTNDVLREPIESPLVSNSIEARTDEGVRKSAQRMIEQLGRLSSDELAALRSVGGHDATDAADRQAAFEAVWHRVSVPSGSKRHSLREALATVAAIYASHPDCHQGPSVRGSFVESLRRQLDSERRLADRKDHVGAFERLLSQLCEATSTSRDGLLLRLVQFVVAEPSNGGRRTIDFADLLLEVADWNDPLSPTPARWRQLLKTADRGAVVVK